MLHTTELEQQQPEANNTMLVRLIMLTTNDSVWSFYFEKFIV